MREENGIVEIKKAINKLGAKHIEHISVYGSGNELRLTGKNQTCKSDISFTFYLNFISPFCTAPLDSFSWGIANRTTSVRISQDTWATGKGYFEDRRPAANCCPYIVTGKIMTTIMVSIINFLLTCTWLNERISCFL